MPPIEHALIGGVLCWRYARGEWRVSPAQPDRPTGLPTLRSQIARRWAALTHVPPFDRYAPQWRHGTTWGCVG